MESWRIRASIQRYTDLLEEARANKRSTQERLSTVHEFAAQHRRQSSLMQDDLDARRRALANATIDPTRVRIMRGFSQGLSSLLDEGNVHLSRMESQKYQIGRVESNLEELVGRYGRDERSYQDTLTDLRRQLKTAEAEEAIAHA